MHPQCPLYVPVLQRLRIRLLISDVYKRQIDGDYLQAKGTSLGGDDGIAVAYALAILDDDSLAHPPIEAVFTVDEEIGMLGACLLYTSRCV